MTMPITTEQLAILQHSIGADQYGQGGGYRSHYVTDDGDKDCAALVALGLMSRNQRLSNTDMAGGATQAVFNVTPEGAAHVRTQSPKPPKVTAGRQRYLKWLDADSDMKFGEWLKAQDKVPEWAKRHRHNCAKCGQLFWTQDYHDEFCWEHRIVEA